VVADDQDDELGDLPGGLGEYGESSQPVALPVFELVQQLAWGEHRRQRVVEPGHADRRRSGSRRVAERARVMR
jgi:hypothetical protein